MSTDLPRAEDAIWEKVAERSESVKRAQERAMAAAERADAAIDARIRKVVREELLSCGLLTATDESGSVSDLLGPVRGGGVDV